MGPQAAVPVAPTAGSGSSSAPPAIDGIAAPLTAIAQDCFRPFDPATRHWFDLGLEDGKLLLCINNHVDAPFGCDVVDPQTGALGQLNVPPNLAGYGLSGDGHVQAGDADVDVAAATISFSHQAPRPLHDAKQKYALPADVVPRWLWFAGNTAYVLGSDDLLYPIEDGKPPQAPFHGMRAGGVGVSGGQIVVQEAALSRLTVMDGITHRTTHGRARHDEPCHPDAGSACGAHLAQHYRPYLDATIIPDGSGYVGIDPHGAVFRLDDHLAETARVPLVMCSAQ
jgi:hypothetical protein